MAQVASGNLVDDAGYIKPAWAKWDDAPSDAFIVGEVTRCLMDPGYFVNTYCSVYEAVRPEEENIDQTVSGGQWVQFTLWPAQHEPLRMMHKHNKTLHLKARQLGLTWLCLGYALWTIIFRPLSTVLLFSRRDTEAMDLLRRLKGMFQRLPIWLTPEGSFNAKGGFVGAGGHQWTLPQGSRVMAFPTSAGDSYTATLAIVDEADLVQDLNKLLSSVKPTIDNGGKLVLVSRVDKAKPLSPFKNIYRGARDGLTTFKTCFLPWSAHPRRTQEWYEEQKAESLARTFSLDFLHEQYPATDEEALEPRQLSKRFPASVLAPFFEKMPNLYWSVGTKIEWYQTDDGEEWEPAKYGTPPESAKKSISCPRIPGLKIYDLPRIGLHCTIGCDPAQEMPESNDSAIVCIDDLTGAEVASVRGKFAPKVLARYSAELCEYYSQMPYARCSVMFERNNHGHAFLLWWESNKNEDHCRAHLLYGHDKQRGWNQTASSKELMCHRVAQRITDGKLRLRTRQVMTELASIECDTLEAPEGELDDSAIAFCLAITGADLRKKSSWKLAVGD